VDRLTEYYFDIETTGLDPKTDRIITIQWQPLDRVTGDPMDDLTILKEWESTEESIVREFLRHFDREYTFDFVPVGENLLFDFSFLGRKVAEYGLGDTGPQYFCDRPHIDIRPIEVMINRGFKGYDRVIDAEGELAKVDIPRLYEEKKFGEIISYVRREAQVFVRAYGILKREMPLLLDKLRVDKNQKE